MHRPYFDMTASGARMREIRKFCGLSVKEVVDYMGLESTQAVYKWESGKCFPQADTLIALAMLYEVNPKDLLVEEGREPSFCFVFFVLPVRRTIYFFRCLRGYEIEEHCMI